MEKSNKKEKTKCMSGRKVIHQMCQDSFSDAYTDHRLPTHAPQMECHGHVSTGRPA